MESFQQFPGVGGQGISMVCIISRCFDGVGEKGGFGLMGWDRAEFFSTEE